MTEATGQELTISSPTYEIYKGTELHSSGNMKVDGMILSAPFEPTEAGVYYLVATIYLGSERIKRTGTIRVEKSER